MPNTEDQKVTLAELSTKLDRVLTDLATLTTNRSHDREAQIRTEARQNAHTEEIGKLDDRVSKQDDRLRGVELRVAAYSVAGGSLAALALSIISKAFGL